MHWLFYLVVFLCLYSTPPTDYTYLNADSPEIKAFEEWIHQHAKINGMKIQDYPGMNRGLMATDNIAVNDTLIEIGLDTVISPSLVLQSLSDSNKELFRQMDDDLILTAFLIQERMKEKESYWYPWFQVLPKHPVIPFLFSESDIKEFEDPVIINRMHIQQDDSFNTYISFIHHLHSYFFSISSSLSMKKWACSYDAFVWAFTMVKTRSVTDQHLIIPFLDFRNYISTDSPFSATTTASEKQYIIDEEKNVLRVIATRAVKPSRQVYMDYEGYGSHYYLLTYGFVSISNIYDCLLIPLPEDIHYTPLLEEVLLDLGYASDHSVCVDITRYLNDRVLAFFLLKDANPTHLQQCIDYYHKIVEKKQHGNWEVNDIRKCALGVYSDNTKELWDSVQDDLKQQLYNHLLHVQQYYSTSIGYDNFQLHKQYHSLQVPRILAYKWRISRKHLLEMAISHLQTTQIQPEEEQKPELNEPLMHVNEWVKLMSDEVKLSVAETPWGGTNLIAKDKVHKGDIVLQIHEDGVFSMKTVRSHSILGKTMIELEKQGISSHLLETLVLLWEKFDNERWSAFQPFLVLLPELKYFSHPVLLSEEIVYQLYGSDVLNEIFAFNYTLHHDYEVCQQLIQQNKILFKEFHKKGIFTWEHFLWSYLILEWKSEYINGEEVLIPLIALAQSSIYQYYGEYNDILYDNGTYVIYATESSQFTNDYTIKQGYANWYMLVYKGELEMALQNDCIRWNLELSIEDDDFEEKMKKLEENGLSLYEQFCLPTKAELLPTEFISMLSILQNKTVSTVDDKKELLLSSIKEKMKEYVTLVRSDRTRSRRGHASSTFQLLNRFLLSEKRLLQDLRKSILSLS